MNDIENAKVKRLVARLKNISEKTGGNIPTWMLDENRYGKGALTEAEQHEWAESVCQSMRGSVALLYLIECGYRWGFRDGEYQFKSTELVFGLTRDLVENVLIKYVEDDLIQHKPTERYIAVYQFYQANNQDQQGDGKSWFNDFLDDVFTDLANRIRNGEDVPFKPMVH